MRTAVHSCEVRIFTSLIMLVSFLGFLFKLIIRFKFLRLGIAPQWGGETCKLYVKDSSIEFSSIHIQNMISVLYR